MSEPVVQVTGVRQLRTAVRRAEGDLGDFKEANAAAATIASRAAAAGAPRLTGLLAASVRPGATRTQAIVRAGGSRVPYAQAIHWGWPRRHIAPHPFASEAAQATEPTWLPVYFAAIERIVARIAERSHP